MANDDNTLKIQVEDISFQASPVASRPTTSADASTASTYAATAQPAQPPGAWTTTNPMPVKMIGQQSTARTPEAKAGKEAEAQESPSARILNVATEFVARQFPILGGMIDKATRTVNIGNEFIQAVKGLRTSQTDQPQAKEPSPASETAQTKKIEAIAQPITQQPAPAQPSPQVAPAPKAVAAEQTIKQVQTSAIVQKSTPAIEKTTIAAAPQSIESPSARILSVVTDFVAKQFPILSGMIDRVKKTVDIGQGFLQAVKTTQSPQADPQTKKPEAKENRSDQSAKQAAIPKPAIQQAAPKDAGKAEQPAAFPLGRGQLPNVQRAVPAAQVHEAPQQAVPTGRGLLPSVAKSEPEANVALPVIRATAANSAIPTVTAAESVVASGVAAESAAVAQGTAAAAAATGLSALASACPPAAIAVAAIAVAATAAVEAFKYASDKMIERGRELQQYSPALSQAFAVSEVRQIRADMHEAQTTGPAIARLIDAQSRTSAEFQRILEPFKKLIAETLASIAEKIADIAETIGPYMSGIMEALAGLTRIVGDLALGPLGLPSLMRDVANLPENIRRAMAREDVNGILVDQLNELAAGARAFAGIRGPRTGPGDVARDPNDPMNIPAFGMP